MTFTFNFSSKEEYLEQRAEWKAEYKALSKEIRELKRARKQFKWEYRPKGNDTMKRKTKVGENPDYNSSASWMAASRKHAARNLLEVLREAKEEAGLQRQARLEAEHEMA